MLSYAMLSGRIITDSEIINVNSKVINTIVKNILLLIKGAEVS